MSIALWQSQKYVDTVCITFNVRLFSILYTVILITNNYRELPTKTDICRQLPTNTIYRQQTRNSEAHRQNADKYNLPTQRS